MRISFLVPRCTPDNSHGRYVIELAQRLAEAHSVTVYSGAFWHPLRSRVHCRFVLVPSRPAIARLASLWATSLALAPRRAADIVHIQGADAPVGNVVTAHCCNAAMRAAAPADVSLTRRWNYAIGTAAERHCFLQPSTRRLIAVSRQVARDVERYYGVAPERIVLIPHGVDAETFHPRNRAQHREAIRQRLAIATDDFVIAFVGRDFRLKGLPVLLEAVRRSGLRITIIAIGVGPQRAPEGIRRSNGPSGRVLCVGPVSESVPYYAAADCFALPTRYDTFSLATLEAMASGLPVVVSRAAGVSELLSPGSDSFVLERPDDVDVLAHALESLVRDQGLREALGEAARKTAERHSWDEVARLTLEVYRETLVGVAQRT